MENLRVASAMAITDLGASHPDHARYVITNEATGRHFSADARTVQFLESLRRDVGVAEAAARARISPSQASQLVTALSRNGLVAGTSIDGDAPAAKQPIEGKLISLKFDLANAARLARRLSWLGRLLFSTPMAILWVFLLLLALAIFLGNTAQVTASLTAMAQGGVAGWLPVALMFVTIKAVHELGHILAYRTMCLREGFDPGPIRVGVMIFAATPFPFTDVTGAWRISSRWRRATIGAAGIYFESLTVALLVLAWATLDLGVLEPVILQVAVISGALTLLFNLNPAVKLDGYYILTDLTRQPNLSGRASQAARSFVWRLLGADAARPGRLEFGYWIISYAYRWTIFASVFWIAYRFDPRLANVILIAAITLLVIRPIFGTLKPVLTKASPIRLALTATVMGAAILACFIPFQARLLTDGQMFIYRSETVRPSEPAQLVMTGEQDGALSFEQPDLAYDRLSLQTRLEVISNTARGLGLSAPERAALENDKRSLETQIADLDVRIARLTPARTDASVLSPQDAVLFEGQWVTTATEAATAALSVPAAPYLKLTLDQNRLEPGMSNDLRVRLIDQPDCEFAAAPVRPWGEAVAREGRVSLEAEPTAALPNCAQVIRNGAAIVARVPLPPRSIFERLRTQVRRLLQERLPFEQEA